MTRNAPASPSSHQPDTTVLLAALLVKLWAVSLVLRLKLWWASLFRRLPRKLQRKLPVLYPLRNHFLLAHVKVKNLHRGFLNFFEFITADDLPAEDLETELGVSVHQELPAMQQTLLCYYQLPACTGPLAVARFTCRNDDNQIIEVSEERYTRTSADEERFQTEVVDSMHCGMDCFVISGQPAEKFPKIAALLADDDTDVI